MTKPDYELLTHHEEYQKALREVLAPTLEYKAKWEELKKYVEISKIEDLQDNGKIDPDAFLTCEAQWGFDMGMIWIRDFMAELASLPEVEER